MNHTQTASAPSATLQVTVHSLRNNNGAVLLSIFNAPDGFPTNNAKAVRTVQASVQDYQSEIVLEDLPEGTYAISLLHDENGNGKMDTGPFGIPKEGYGASNDAKVTFGPPKFDDAKFELRHETSIRIKMRYM